jgi:alkanesulfonate monooxygenase SsuD/methylene tetrahydromethanopterin reductase-like flavin-dependent oxidoreductase (luciferase family)
VTASPKLYLRSYPEPDGMEAHAAAVETDGWDGMLLTDTQNLSMDVFASMYLAASATSHLEVGTAVTNLIVASVVKSSSWFKEFGPFRPIYLFSRSARFP